MTGQIEPSGSSLRELIRVRGFRRLWIGDAISLLGDWFTYVAVGTLALAADQGLVSVAIVLLGHSLPRALCAPWAGRLADRIDRRTILIVFSLLRALTVLAMLVAAQAQALAAVQVLLFVRMAFGAFIDPAATAMLPQLVAPEQLARANTLLGATWSVMFAIGVALGGLVTAEIGVLASLGVDALTFVLAAAVFCSLPRALPHAERGPSVAAPPERGWTIAWRRPDILGAALGKLPAALANGGAWVLLHARADDQLFGATATSLGILHAARAVGTGLGPLLWIGPLRASEWGLRLSNALSLVAVALFALTDRPTPTLVAATLWGIGVGANWVTASTRMQVLTPNDQLGRVASVDLVAQSLSQCVGGLGGAWLSDRWRDPTLSAWWGGVAGLLGWLAIAAAVRASKRVRASALILAPVLLGLTACANDPAPVAPPLPESSVREVQNEPPLQPDPTLAGLSALAVYHDDFARAELYTWTTQAQLERLASTRCLLQAETATGGWSSPFSLALEELARPGSPSAGSPSARVATLLLEHEALKRRRYAWTSPFATTLGLASRRYGDVLLRIELDPRAYLAYFEPAAATPLRFVDMHGEPVTPEQVLAEPERLAAVYHVRDSSPKEPAYREYVVCSEAMITAWSVATPEIRARIDHELELLGTLAESTLAQLPRAAVEQPAAPDWRSAAQDPTPLALWHASLAFDNQRYRPTRAAIEHVRAALRETRTGEPLIHHPQAEPCRR